MQNGLYYGRTCSQDGLCTLFIDISKQNLNIHYISNLTPELCTIQCKELGGCATKMQYMYTTIHIRAMTTFFLDELIELKAMCYCMCFYTFENVYHMGPVPTILLNSILSIA